LRSYPDTREDGRGPELEAQTVDVPLNVRLICRRHDDVSLGDVPVLIIFRQLSEVGMNALHVDVRQPLPDQVRYDYLGLS